MSARLRIACTLTAVALALAAATGVRAEGPLYAVEPFLPGDDASGRRLEAALLVRDLRDYHAEGERQRTRLRRTSPGASLLSPGEQRRLFGFDSLEELGRLIELADPTGREPVAAGAAVFSTPDGFGFQLLLRAAPGFAGRLGEALRSDAPPPWAAPGPEGGVVFSLAGRTLAGSQDGDGWVRLAPRGEDLAAGPGGAVLLEGPVAGRVGDCNEVLLLRGGGSLSAVIAGGGGGETPGGAGPAAQLLAAARMLAFGLARDGAGTSGLRVVLDHPMLAQFAPMLSPPEATNRLFALWGLDATEFLSLQLPPLVLTAGAPALAARLQAAPHPPPPAVLEALSAFDGSVGFARFGSPGDWAVALGFQSEEGAEALLPALPGWLAELGKEEGAELLGAIADAAIPGGDGSAITFPPDSGLGHIGAVRAGRFVVVTGQPGRRAALLSAAAGSGRPGPPALTDGVRATLERPSLLSAHKVLGNELSLFGGMGLLAFMAREGARAEAARDEAGDSGPLAAYSEAALEHLPALMRLAEAQFDLTYDVNLHLEVGEGLLVLELLSSELPEPGAYLEAVNRKFEGDSAGYYDGLMDLALGAGGSLAGRRARTALLYNPMGEVAMLGILAGIAVPNFLNFKVRAARAEAPATLRSLRSALLAHEAETGRPCASFAECDPGLGPRLRWLYLIGPGEDRLAGGAGKRDREAFAAEARALLEERGVAPDPAGERAVAAAVGDPAGNGRLEVWVIDRAGEPYEVRPRPAAVAPPAPQP